MKDIKWEVKYLLATPHTPAHIRVEGTYGDVTKHCSRKPTDMPEEIIIERSKRAITNYFEYNG